MVQKAACSGRWIKYGSLLKSSFFKAAVNCLDNLRRRIKRIQDGGTRGHILRLRHDFFRLLVFAVPSRIACVKRLREAAESRIGAQNFQLPFIGEVSRAIQMIGDLHGCEISPKYSALPCCRGHIGRKIQCRKIHLRKFCVYDGRRVRLGMIFRCRQINRRVDYLSFVNRPHGFGICGRLVRFNRSRCRFCIRFCRCILMLVCQRLRTIQYRLRSRSIYP